ncbi:HTH-type transcriptional regulator / antitoxin HigA [Marinobacter segnicrescens]|uniref:HTH-type transcriptional regulator / antitoxin HigA n=1 Tax=Marinobacter segnicrescens TaxID=430453 RepID=A0A1I0HRC1_9GAMM|nr:ImmA/IrrE family metallo-endopeptidase [Marinobacter segnicrescens]SET86566.1 HTH-type transcriptional regulator / antitoxin HigA [Marinobacter segnicrescens]
MDHLKIIKTPEEHEAALARLMELMDADAQEGSREADELEVLAMLIDQYEQREFPIDRPDPVEAIRFRMDQQGLKNKDLIPYIGSASKVSEVLNGSRRLSLNMIRRLNAGLGIPADILIQERVQETAREKDIDWQAFPLSEMKKRGYFEGFEGSLRELKEYAAEWVTRLLTGVRGGFDLEPAMLRTTSHLRTNDKVSDHYALWAWQARVLQRAAEQQLPTTYQSGTVNLEWMRNLARLSWSEKGPELAREYLEKSGIHLVIEPHLPKTYLDGAACVDANGSPVIALTLRYKWLDNFWFTLMHELAHVALHLDGSEAWFIDNLEAETEDDQEQQADALAQNALLPEGIHYHAISEAVAVRRLANELNIAPTIIAGRIRHDTGNHKMFGSAFREKVSLEVDC